MPVHDIAFLAEQVCAVKQKMNDIRGSSELNGPPKGTLKMVMEMGAAATFPGRFCFTLKLLLLLTIAAAFPDAKQLQIVGEINEQGPWLGLITVYPPEERAFMAAKALKPHPKYPFVDLSGRRFHIGTIHGRKVIYVRCGVGLMNAAAATQMMADLFKVVGVVHFGIAGNANSTLSMGDVSVPKYVAHNGLWDWLQNAGSQEEDGSITHLIVGSYNVPQGKRENLLGKISYQLNEFYSESGAANNPQYSLWANVSSQWFSLAQNLKDLNLSACVNSTVCLPKPPKMVLGLRASTANIFIDNGVYREFLYQKLGVSSVDEETAAVVMTCLSNNLKVIVFRGLSDLAGAQKGTNAIDVFGPLAATNAVKATLEFIKILHYT